ncbi:hypothetical protein IR010_00565 [Flavobacterium sp. MR2016-29]|uniref:hypothetical protein n=1 Tax=Flavobacterium sp. MR2016-29 TaxID=2783795 RepID=UPI00188C710E|nr:hypothetical protein [Flavobacterium sp. MR2016-29]MBF4491014.1 hypothetical protein [Flavobacterium sp. MR2016-29]
MKPIIAFLTFFLSLTSFAQELPSPYESGFEFPIGAKFTIKLNTADPENITYSIIKFEQFTEIIDSFDHDDLFEKDGEEGTIDFYFCLGSNGDTEAEKNKNMKVLLLFKNRTKLSLKYFSEIQLNEEEEFKETSNVGAHPGAIGNEMWPYMINMIRIRDFKISK